MNLTEIRTLVRTHLDLPDEDDLPTVLIDAYVREGFNRTMAYCTEWPFLETTWEVSNAGGADHIVLPTDAEASGITTLREVDFGRLQHIPHEYAEQTFITTAVGGAPMYYSTWGGNIYLWPVPNSERQYVMRGFRKPTDWVSGGAASAADGDERLHVLYAWYACSLAYAQQEDEVLEQVYMQRWETGVRTIRDQIMAPSRGRPAIMSKGLTGGLLPQRWMFDLE